MWKYLPWPFLMDWKKIDQKRNGTWLALEKLMKWQILSAHTATFEETEQIHVLNIVCKGNFVFLDVLLLEIKQNSYSYSNRKDP